MDGLFSKEMNPIILLLLTVSLQAQTNLAQPKATNQTWRVQINLVLTNQASLQPLLNNVMENFDRFKESKGLLAIDSVYRTEQTLAIVKFERVTELPSVRAIPQQQSRMDLPPLPPDMKQAVLRTSPAPPALPTEAKAGETYREAQSRFMQKRQGLRRNE